MRIVALSGNSWMGLLAWFPTQVRLQDGLHGCLDSLVRLTRRLALGTTYSSRWGYKLASLPWQDSMIRPRAWVPPHYLGIQRVCTDSLVR